ncbi:MAG: family 43 glycosylhydrolase [Lachnospiraceae bacterium]|jgi:hypothetical protein|nr:family 43 glycosylhydrolase [Lachnospiraceae bacterium]
MKKLICNPLNLEYRYQMREGKDLDGNTKIIAYREAADPTLIVFNGNYLMFASMSGGFWYSDDLYEWHFKLTPELPNYDYAPDVQVIDGAVVFCASRANENCSFYRSANPILEPFTAIAESFPFWDPHLFHDDDKRLYLYWGCSNREPIYGIELDPQTFTPISAKTSLIYEDEEAKLWERNGENNGIVLSCDPGAVPFWNQQAKPYIEGPYVTKHNGCYYLQYAAPGTEHNVYADGVYVASSPLGPYQYQEHNPFSSKPGGFIHGAGHGSTFADKWGNLWHVSTMRISVNEMFERRIGLFPCAIDADGVMYCNQHFADFPFYLPEEKVADTNSLLPPFMLLSYDKKVTASSAAAGHEAEKSANEDIREWWAAQISGEDEWLAMDLGDSHQVAAIQVNFADHQVSPPWSKAETASLSSEENEQKNNYQEAVAKHGRYIEVNPKSSEYILEGSLDGIEWELIADRSGNGGKVRDYAHDLVVLENPLQLRHLRISKMKLSYNAIPAISGLRVFGNGQGLPPAKVEDIKAGREAGGDISLKWQAVAGATGYNVRYGVQSDKLYSSWIVFDSTELVLSTINHNTCYFIAVDSFNENGVTKGTHFSVS